MNCLLSDRIFTLERVAFKRERKGFSLDFRSTTPCALEGGLGGALKTLALKVHYALKIVDQGQAGALIQGNLRQFTLGV